jgi:hypothetical protein
MKTKHVFDRADKEKSADSTQRISRPDRLAEKSAGATLNKEGKIIQHGCSQDRETR